MHHYPILVMTPEMPSSLAFAPKENNLHALLRQFQRPSRLDSTTDAQAQPEGKYFDVYHVDPPFNVYQNFLLLKGTDVGVHRAPFQQVDWVTMHRQRRVTPVIVCWDRWIGLCDEEKDPPYEGFADEPYIVDSFYDVLVDGKPTWWATIVHCGCYGD